MRSLMRILGCGAGVAVIFGITSCGPSEHRTQPLVDAAARACPASSLPAESAATSTATARTVPSSQITIQFQTPLTRPATSPTIAQSSTGAKAITPSADDCAAIAQAYGKVASTTCPIVPVPGTLKEAVIETSGAKWAFGQMEAKPGCLIPDGTGHGVDPNSLYPLSSSPENSGVFERPPEGTWQLNYVESIPFPCPATETPGPNNAFLPLAVLRAVGVPYATTGCDQVALPTLPGR
jgi:hypothetical protein